MKKYYKHTVLFALLFSVLSYGQQKKIQKANDKFERFAYVDAQKILLKVANEGYRSKDLFQKLGDSFYLVADYENACKWYSELLNDHANELKPIYYFRYAQSLKSTQRYEESDKIMSKFYTFENEDSRAQRYQSNPQYLLAIDFQSGRYKVANLKANSEYSDFGPAFYGDEIVFASARDTGLIAKRVHGWNDKPFLELYKGQVKEKSKEITEVKKFSNKINTRYHESTPVFTNDLKTVYFTRNNYNNGKYRKDKKGINKLKIYKSTIDDKGRWSSAESIRFNNDEYSVGHPALSPDNKKLYFSSDMPGGFGNSDIYEATIAEDGTLGDPRNLGENINTEGRESFPFVSKSGDFYFASDGHIGLGGLDLFVTTINVAGKVGPVINLGEPANTPQDDFAFIINDETKIGYFSSNRYGGKGDDDIYKFRQLEGIKRECEILLKGLVTDKDTDSILPNSKVALYDLENNLVEEMVVGPSAEYSFLVDCDNKYLLRANKAKYISVEELITTPKENETLDTPLQLETKIKKFVIGQDLGKILNLNPIYFDFDKSEIRYDASVELAKVIAVMHENPKMKIDVRSHTDSRGDDNYNEQLSEMRAKSTVAYIISKGISADRLTGKGYGESRLVNGCSNGIPCSVEKHQLNRRSEFIILAK